MERLELSRAGVGDLPTRPTPTPRHTYAVSWMPWCEWVLRSLRIRALARSERPGRQPGLGLLGARRQVDVGKAHVDRVAPEERHGLRVRHRDILGNPYLPRGPDGACRPVSQLRAAVRICNTSGRACSTPEACPTARPTSTRPALAAARPEAPFGRARLRLVLSCRRGLEEDLTWVLPPQIRRRRIQALLGAGMLRT